MAKQPLDPEPYPSDPRSRPLRSDIPDGRYVYVRDVDGVIHVAPDEPHMHPKVLGDAEPAQYAGDMEIANGNVVEITNCSGTFQFDSVDGLWSVVEAIEELGLLVADRAVVWWPPDGTTRPRVLERGDW